MAMQLNQNQKFVAKGTSLGAALCLAVVVITYNVMQPVLGMEEALHRFFYALGCLSFAILPLVVGIGLVSNEHFLTMVINPLAGKASGKIVVYSRFLQNTLEQFVVFSIGLLILSIFLDPSSMRLLPALTVNFVLGRALFLAGELRNPLHRVVGFAMSSYVGIIVILFDMYKMIRVGI